MSEIKSTLDLVMERTRNLSLSDEERSAQRREGFLKNLAGLVQRFEDGHLRKTEIEREIVRLQEAHGITDGWVLLKGLAGQLDLDKDNRAVCRLLEQICRVAADPLAAVIEGYRKAILEATEKRSEAIRRELAQTRRISGSAVVALPHADSGLTADAAAIKSEFTDRLEQAVAELTVGGGEADKS